MKRTIAAAAAFFLLGTGPFLTAHAQSASGPCQSEQHRQFDFWVGSWTVYANGALAGTNEIQLIHNECVLHESWTSATSSYTGNSLNLYDAPRGVWHQSWADSSGLLLQLEGGFQNGQMTLSGTRPNAEGTPVTHRISWTPNADGTIRQLWETREQGKEDWTVAFDGLYKKD